MNANETHQLRVHAEVLFYMRTCENTITQKIINILSEASMQGALELHVEKMI